MVETMPAEGLTLAWAWLLLLLPVPWLVEPLKDLVFNRPQSSHNFLSGVFDRVKLFCTVYDPNTGRYRFDFSLFVQIAIGAIVVLGVITYLLIEIRRARRRKKEAESC